jgi:serine-type D-Ala-D-Ala carboxypeptidase (penicillin-binding protein 5/6)
MWQPFRPRRVVLTLCSLCAVLTSLPAVYTHAAVTPIATPATMDVQVRVHPGFQLPTPALAGGKTSKENHLATYAKSAVVMDYSTGKVLFEKNAHEKLPMASITKIMTMLLIMEALDDGKIKLTDRVKTSEYAASMGGSQIFLEPGETMTVADLLKGIAIVSANDACVAMAEYIAGSEEAFVDEMNERAKQLGMDDTHFANCNGLPVANHYSSAHDIAMMSRELLKHDEITKWTSVYSDYLRKDSEHPLWLVNTNKLVRFYDGVDGLKTGYTAEAKYCLSATAKRDGFRVIAVVMGEPQVKVRNAEVSQLLNWSFSHYTSKVIYQQGQVVTQVKVPKGVPKNLHVIAGDTVGIVHKRGNKLMYETKMNLFKLRAPVKERQRVGTLQVFEGDDLVAEVPLLAREHVRKAGLFESIGRTMRDLVTFGKN